MGILFRSRRKIAPNLWLNFSKSGVSTSTRLGPVTVNSRARVTVRLGHGVSWRLFK